MTKSAGPPPEGWQLSAELKPKTPQVPVPDPAEAAEVVPPAWLDAAEGVRTTVKWMVTAFALVGGVMFAKGFVTTPQLSWDDNKGQLVGAWVTGAFGLVALGWLIYQAVGMIRPTLFELGDLPQGYRDLINQEPRFYLPSDAQSFDQFLQGLNALRKNENDWRTVVAARQDQLTEAQQTSPLIQSAIDAAALELKRAKATHASLMRELTVYNRARTSLLDRAGYWRASRGLDTSIWWMVIAAVLVAVGGIGYQLLLAAPAEPDTNKEAAPAAKVGELVRSDTPAGRQLWRDMHLADCQADPGSPRIPVVVASGRGNQTAPYQVSTIPTRRCRIATFTVVDAVARLNAPTTTVITYTPAPTTTSDS